MREKKVFAGGGSPGSCTCDADAYYAMGTTHDKVDITKLTESDIGRWVVYKPSFGKEERGRIKSWNDTYVFVVYKCDNQWDRFQDFTACATNPDDLMFV